MMEYLGLGGLASKSPAIVGYASTVGGALLAVSVGPDTLPIVGAAIGVGIGIAWAVVGSNRDRANEALTKQLSLLQTLLESKDRQIQARDEERVLVRKARLDLEEANERLAVRIARLEAEKGDHERPTPQPR